MHKKSYNKKNKFWTLWRSCNLTAFTHSSAGPVVHPFASCYEGPMFNPQGGTCVNRDSPVSIVSLQLGQISTLRTVF
jgi:hypothetical protein